MQAKQTLDQLRKYLPIQYPLGVFIHNNMLQAFEDQPFEQGVYQASRIYGAQVAMNEDYYQEKFRQGRILPEVLKQLIADTVKAYSLEQGIAGVSGDRLIHYLLENPLRFPERVCSGTAEVSTHWDEHLRIAQQTKPVAFPVKQDDVKEWKLALKFLGEDIDDYFQPVLIRFISSYLDQGLAIWENPDSHEGLLVSMRHFLRANRFVTGEWVKRAMEYLDHTDEDNLEENLWKILHERSNGSESHYLMVTLLELRGWAGMINKFETEPEIIPRYAPKVSLLEYVYCYLALEEGARQWSLQKLNLTTDPLWDQCVQLNLDQRAWLLDRVKDKLAFPTLQASIHELNRLFEVVAKFDGEARSMLWQKAFDFSERNVRLNILADRTRKFHQDKKQQVTPMARAYFCIDDREESIRRHLEETNPRIETHGVVGFFGLDMKVRTVLHPQEIAHCPPVVTPAKIVEEVVCSGHEHQHGRFGELLNRLGRQELGFFYATRGSLKSVLWTLAVGLIGPIVLPMRIFFPRSAVRIKEMIKRRLNPQPPTQLSFVWVGRKDQQLQMGYSTSEMANIVATILRFVGTLNGFPKWNFMIGHGATSSNNPFKNAYGCGACSGRAGIPNARVFCGMANNIEVRKLLKADHNIDIPDDSHFLACYHDTSTDDVNIYDLPEFSLEDRGELNSLLADLSKASKLNALERCRNFEKANNVHNEEQAFEHVHERAMNLAEPRPEYGHTNNNLCIIGRRGITKGMFMDRRSFLTSYDASTDTEGKILAQVMAGAVPVAGGINLDYYFSRVDNERYGCGTKLPLNVASLLGVMTGGAGDLRIGLARQMVELHEPVRITIVIEAKYDVVMGIVQHHARMKRLVENFWIHLCTIDPENGQIYLYSENGFKAWDGLPEALPKVRSSRDYFMGKFGPLPFVEIAGGQT